MCINKQYEPAVTVVMISYNDEAIINDCLKSIRKQDYPQNLIKIVMVDGGSLDGTFDIAKRYNVDVICRPDLRDSPNVRGGIALTIAETELVLFVSADNRLQEHDVLTQMVNSMSDHEIVGCETLRYGYNKTDPIISRYFALIGGADPIAVGLGKADRGPHDIVKWHGHGDVDDCGYYYKVSFDKDVSKIPTLGANGFLFRKNLLSKATLMDHAYHIDMCVELILKGYNKFSFVKNRHIVHFLDMKLLSFLKRRLLYAKMYDGNEVSRIYSVYQSSDFVKLLVLIISNLTFIIPFIRSCKGYVRQRDISWFLHPVISFVFTVGYSVFFVRKIFSR